MRKAAKSLSAGDVVSSGETVVRVYTTVAQWKQWKSRKVFVQLEKAGRTRVAEWNASTLIAVH